MNNTDLQCPLYGHVQAKIEFICLNQGCQTENKIICTHCVGEHFIHFPELMRLSNLGNGLIQFIEQQIQDKKTDVQELKKQIIQSITQDIENKFNSFLKPLLELESTFRSFCTDIHGLEELRKVTALLRENCKIDKEQSTEAFIILFKQSFLDNTVNKTIQYLNGLQQKMNSINQDQNQVENKQEQPNLLRQSGPINFQLNNPMRQSGAPQPIQVGPMNNNVGPKIGAPQPIQAGHMNNYPKIKPGAPQPIQAGRMNNYPVPQIMPQPNSGLFVSQPRIIPNFQNQQIN